jgi:hypothetical protein
MSVLQANSNGPTLKHVNKPFLEVFVALLLLQPSRTLVWSLEVREIIVV